MYHQASKFPLCLAAVKSCLATLPRVALAAIVGLAAVAFLDRDARAGDLVVRYDQSQLIRLPRPAADVIIGNPSIADVTIQGGNLLVVTGKTFGITNIIALDAEGNVIQDQRVVVERDDQRMVVLYKGAQRESYSCTPTCSPTITIGDQSAYFDLISKHAQNKAGVSVGATAGGPQPADQ
jgi:hypothetical protein